MTEYEAPIVVDYYSDVLCVWAWIAQPRLDELHRQWGDRVTVRHRFVDIFGDAHEKIPRQWGAEDGYDRFHAHLENSAAAFEHVSIHPDIWRCVRPRSSMSAHLVLKAAEIVAGGSALEAMAKTIRQQFFSNGRDIGMLDELLSIAEEQNIDRGELDTCIEDGRAIAALSQDMRRAGDKGVKGSPTWVLNDGRQLLYGNVGYRILHANIEELAKNPAEEASWC